MKRIAIIIIMALVIVRCNSVSAIKPENNKRSLDDLAAYNIVRDVIEFRVNGKLVRTSGGSIRRFVFEESSSEWLNITTNMHNEQRTINVNLSGTTPGDYSLDEEDVKVESHGVFFPNYIDDIANGYSF